MKSVHTATMISGVQLGGEEAIQEQNSSCMLLASESVDGPKDDFFIDISDIALPYEFKIPDFIQWLHPARCLFL